MKEGEKNIEEIFRKKLENFESPVNDTIWSNISNGINTTGMSATTVLGKTVLSKIFSTIGIALSTGLVATAITIFVMSDKDQEHEISDISDIPSKAVIAPQKEKRVDIEEVKVVQVPTSNPTHQGDPQLEEKSSIKENAQSDKSSNEYRREPSAISSFMTSQRELDRQKNNTNKTEMVVDANEVLENNPIEETTPISFTENTTAISASILASPVGGYAPLEVYFSNQGHGSNLVWSFGDGEVSREETPTHIYEGHGIYTVELVVTDDNGKVSKEQREIEVLAKSALTNIPNVFTPNGDHFNDEYIIEGKNIKEFRLIIIDRNGKEIFSSNSIEIGWNGKDKYDKEVSAGTYSYVVIAFGEDGKKYEHKGAIQLIR